MKKNYTFIIIIFLLSFFICSNNVNAATLTGEFTNYTTTFRTSTSENVTIGTKTDIQNAFRGVGEGYVLFSFYYANDNANGELPYVVRVNDIYTCDIGTNVFYNDNIHQRATITAKCPVNFSGNNTFTDIEIFTKGQGTRYYLFSQYATFFTESDSATELASILTQLSSISGYIQYSNNIDGQYYYDVRTQIIPVLNNIYSALNGNSTNITDIKNNTSDIKNNTKETNDLIKNDNVSGGETAADDLKNNAAFQDSTGLSGIISMPLTFVNNLGSTCQPISLTIPYMDYTFQVPCIQSIVNNYMPALVVIIKVVVNGLIIYWVMLDIFKIVKSAKNPDDDRIEVLEL